MKRLWLLLLCALPLLWLSAAAGDPPSLKDPLPFQHAEHAKVFGKAGLTCVDCHPVGLSRPDASQDIPQATLPPPPLSSCHGCHQAQASRAPRSAPDQCGLCHADLNELKPADHGLDWVSNHGDAARAAGASCDTCHEASTCFDCHDNRGAGSANPHGPGFRETHGVVARADPRQCSTCHTEASCTACHSTGALPW